MIPELILTFVLSVLPVGAQVKNVAALAWGIEGECTYVPGDYVGPVSNDAALAVGCVILNRVDRPWYPDSIVGVLTQTGQFNPTLITTKVHRPAVDAAHAILENPDLCDKRGLFVYSDKDLRNLGWSHKAQAAIQVYETDGWGLYVFDRFPADIAWSSGKATLVR